LIVLLNTLELIRVISPLPVPELFVP
jgi:hypothetical protein